MQKNYDVIVIGAGHAGVEAALATSRLKKDTALINLYKDKIAAMPCNPSVGGPAKGIVVREIDALGGEMGRAADATALQTKLLNESKGPGVWSLRVQSDKLAYSQYMQKRVVEQPHLTLVADIVQELLFKDEDNHTVVGVQLASGQKLYAPAVILTTGTYLQSEILQGQEHSVSGPNGECTVSGISASLKKAGLVLQRFKTGTPPRVYRHSVDLTAAKLEPGTDLPLAFSFQTEHFTPLSIQEPCYLIHSTAATKKIILDNLSKSAMYSGVMKAVGPRYCPSFEDKIVRFASKDTHQIFLEPETKNGDTWYVQGFSTSMPVPIQEQMLKSLPGFQNVQVKHWAYAIEYDILDPLQLSPSLQVKTVTGLFTAGQINGTSGYEEAAGQGLLAGINAVKWLNAEPPVILRRDQAYIGVMIDDLINKGVNEPYRLLTSRAEHRLLLRNDNAEQRLKPLAYSIGLVSNKEWAKYQAHIAKIATAVALLKAVRFTPKSPLATNLQSKGQATLKQGYSAYEILKIPTVEIAEFFEFVPLLKELNFNQLQSLVIGIRFEGYVQKEYATVERLLKLEKKQIPADINYEQVANLATEARQKLEQIRPLNIGQASRIAGVNPADIQMLLFHLKTVYPILTE